MSKESFVANLISGRGDASQKMRWWLKHGSAMSLYIQKWASKKKIDGRLERAAIRAKIGQGCLDWGTLVYHDQKTPLMTEHAQLELAMIDEALGLPEGEDPRELLSISEFMMENVDKQVLHHQFNIKEFPADRFRDLLLGHMRLFTESVRWFVTPDMNRYASCEEQRMANAVALAAFSTEWL